MTRYLCISVTFLDSFYHGKRDEDNPEWPPSPLRLYQAMLRGARTGCRNPTWSEAKDAAFRSLERSSPPLIVAPDAQRVAGYKRFVPNNDSDQEFERQNRLTTKICCPVRLPGKLDQRIAHYLWRVGDEDGSVSASEATLLCQEARHLLALGWGIDQAVANGRILTRPQVSDLSGTLWRPIPAQAVPDSCLRVPTPGTLKDLENVYESFLASVDGKRYTPPLTPSVFERVRYVPTDYVEVRPFRVFELRHDDGSFCAYSQRKLIHIAGMMRHLARMTMSESPPRGVGDDWVERYVVGHRDENARDHRQFSYVPLPSIGHPHADHLIRRVMVVAPLGDDALLEHLGRRLSGRRLEPTPDTDFGPKGRPSLVHVRYDRMARHYQVPAAVWHSVTPVVLPGHDDRKPAKTHALIERALAQSGVEQPCRFEWSAFSRFPKAFSAHKYDRDGRARGYIRPDHLLTQTAVHMTIRFKDDQPVPGPIVVGAGRHYGFGLFAAQEE